MNECDPNGKTSREFFLKADLKNFRYEPNNVPNEFRLYHCTKEGRNRFALYFSHHKKINDGPWHIEVLINEVDVNPNKVTVHAIDEKCLKHFVPDSVTDLQQKEVLQKVCDILDSDSVKYSILP